MLNNDQSKTISNVPDLFFRRGDHVQGSPLNPITLMAYGDYLNPRSGPFCKTVQNLQKSFNAQLCFVYRHFPKMAPRSLAWKAAEAAEVASAQGKFWEMHDVLSQNSQALEDYHLVKYADQVGLDVPTFLNGMVNHTYAEKVQADIDSGESSGVSGIPTFFITVRSDNAQHVDEILHQLLEMIHSPTLAEERAES